jgi:hypothetical protein
VGAPVAGFLLDRSSLTHIFLVHSVLLVMAAGVVASIPVHAASGDVAAGSVRALLGVMGKDLASSILYASSLVLGIGYGAVWAYAFLLLKELGDHGALALQMPPHRTTAPTAPHRTSPHHTATSRALWSTSLHSVYAWHPNLEQYATVLNKDKNPACRPRMDES